MVHLLIPLQVKSKKKAPTKKHKDRHQLGKVTFSDMDQYLEGYGEDYGALSTQSDILLPDDGEEEMDVAAMRQLRFAKQGRKTSREEELLKSKSASNVEDKRSETGKLESSSKPRKLKRPKREVETSTIPDPRKGQQRESAPEEGDREQQGAMGNGQKEEENTNPQLRPACSEDSMDAHMSYESSSSKSDGEESKGGGVQLPLAKQHFTEGIRRLQLSKEAYEEEHFGKVSHDNIVE